jgi:hypothetical protein
MIISGHIDIRSFGDFYTQIDYERPESASRGFNYSNSLDSERYKPEFTTVCIHHGIRPDVERYLIENFNWLYNHSFAINLMQPGMILPLHNDKYSYYMKNNNVSDINDICRVIIFLQDWKQGHISQIGNKLTPQWEAGDWVCWKGSTDHLAANLGHENRYVLQLTGILK